VQPQCGTRAQELELQTPQYAILPDRVEHPVGIVQASGHVDLPALHRQVEIVRREHQPVVLLLAAPAGDDSGRAPAPVRSRAARAGADSADAVTSIATKVAKVRRRVTTPG
jgi:hypothetical protein